MNCDQQPHYIQLNCVPVRFFPMALPMIRPIIRSIPSKKAILAPQIIKIGLLQMGHLGMKMGILFFLVIKPIGSFAMMVTRKSMNIYGGQNQLMWNASTPYLVWIVYVDF